MRYKIKIYYRILFCILTIVILSPEILQGAKYEYAHRHEFSNDSLAYFGDCHYIQKDYQEAITYYEAYLDGQDNNNTDLSLGEIYYSLGDSYYYTDHYFQAIQNTKKASHIFKNANETVAYKKALKLLANTYSLNANYDEALFHYNLLLDMYANSEYDLIKQADLHFNIAGIYKDWSGYKTAISHYIDALRLYKKSGDKEATVGVYAHLGTCYLNLKNYNKAIANYKICIELDAVYQLDYTNVALDGLGICYQQKQDYDEAEKYLTLARTNLEHSYNTCNMMTNHINLGSLYLSTNRLSEAQLELDRAEVYNDTLRDRSYEITIAKNSGDLFFRTKKYKNAATKYKRAYFLQDSIFNSSTLLKLNEMETSFELIRKNQALNLLQKDNQLKASLLDQERLKKQGVYLAFIILIPLLIIIAYLQNKYKKKKLIVAQERLRFEAVIDAEQKERKRIAQDLHDSLGQMISLIKMKATDLDVHTNACAEHLALRTTIDQAYDELRNISHNIMPGFLDGNSLQRVIEQLVSDYHKLKPNITLKYRNQSKLINLNEKESINIYRVLQEILSNAIKHSQATTLTIQISSQDHLKSIIIEDNGKGFDTKVLQTDYGLGWRNIISRIELIKGTINIESVTGIGTRIKIDLVR